MTRGGQTSFDNDKYLPGIIMRISFGDLLYAPRVINTYDNNNNYSIKKKYYHIMLKLHTV